MKKIRYFIPSFIIMIIIFLFSQQNGQESTQTSLQVLLWIENIFHISIPTLMIRKMAHISEYALLSLSLIYGFYKNNTSVHKTYLYTFIIAFLYACSDEFHQLFTNGRAGQFRDVMIDMIGCLCMLICFYYYKKKQLK